MNSSRVVIASSPRVKARGEQVAGFRFRRQVILGGFIADFACFEARMVVEVDGGEALDGSTDRPRCRALG